MSNDCFGHASFVTVISRAPLQTCVACVNRREIDPEISVSDVHELQVRRSPIRRKGLSRQFLGNPQFNYEPFNSNSVNIRSWSWNYRGCWHQTCPPIVTRFWVDLNTPHCKLPKTQRAFGRPISFRCLIISWHWAICAPAALRRSGSHFSGSLSGIEP